MINMAFIFAVNAATGEFISSFEMEVLLQRGESNVEPTRTAIQALYEQMTGRPCIVRWDFEYRGKQSSVQ